MAKENILSELLREGAEKIGIFLSSEKIEKFFIYLEQLKLWNEKVNLTAIKRDKEIIVKHFLDSLTCYLIMDKDATNLVDIGSGAGFPSLPLKILLPEIKCTLIEARKKKVTFLHHLVRKLELKNVTLINGRAEEIARGEKRESFDVAVGRAVAGLNVLAEYALPYVKVGGCFIVQKGSQVKQLKKARNAFLLLGGRVERIKKINLPFLNQERNLILVRKAGPTPLKYPRRPGIPEKNPL